MEQVDAVIVRLRSKHDWIIMYIVAVVQYQQ